MSMGYYIYDFERGMFWKSNKMGYTNELLEAGNYDYEEALKILKESNLMHIESEMIHSTDMKRLSSIRKEQGIKTKVDMFEVIEPITKKYHKTNPLELIKQELQKNGYYLEEENYKHLSNGEVGRYSLFPENYKTGLNVVITRMDTGNYEVIANKIKLETKNKLDSKSIKKQKP